jgi:methylmalonyl-CoA mutase C-terminal domain/subunit
MFMGLSRRSFEGVAMSKGRIFVGMLGMDMHELGAVAVSGILRDAGFEVIYAGLFQTPASIVQSALDEDVDVIGLSCHSWEYVEYVPELMDLLKKGGVDAAVVLGGSIITATDAEKMQELGVAAIFGAGAEGSTIIGKITELVEARQSRAFV